MTPPLPARIGRYEITDRLGAGGMGVVYLATDPLLHRTVAIKVLPAGDHELRERFGREARSAAGLRHNNVVTIYDVGEHDDQPFIAMEFLDGESMSEMIHRKANLAVERRLQLIIDLCAGLGHAHGRGVIHRDIKPANLMITTDGALKILDFGLARLTAGASQTGLTRAGSVMGTPHYMSPEQVEGETVDQRSDIFSVGLVLYEVLSYQKAFSGDSAPVVLHNILHKTPAPIRTLVPSIDSELEEIVQKGIEKARSARYQELSPLASDLKKVRTRLLKEPGSSTWVRPRPLPVAPLQIRPEGEQTPNRTPRNVRNLDALAQRRAAQVDLHMAAAARQFEERSYEAAIAECENALVFNPQDARALELLERAHHALEGVQVDRWLEEAKALLSAGEWTAAEALIDQSLKLRADSDDAQALQRELREKRRDRERSAERLRAAMSAVERARAHLKDGAFEAAIRCASEALGYDTANIEAQTLKDRALAAIEERRREEDRDRAAREMADTARTRALSGDASGALTELMAFSPPHQLVTETIKELETILRDRVQPLRSSRVPAAVAESKRPVEQAVPARTTRWPIVAAPGIAIVLVAVGVWSFGPASKSQPEAPPGVTPAKLVAPEATIDYRAVVNRALDQYRKGDERGALATVLAIPDSAANKDASGLLDTIRRGAEGRATSARTAAEAAKKTNTPSFGQAAGKQEEARRLSPGAQDSARAVAMFDEATVLFQAAAKSAPTPPPTARLFTAQLRDASRSFDDGDYARATSLYRAILADDPGNADATTGLRNVTRAQEAEQKFVGGGTPTAPLSLEQTRQLTTLLGDGQKQQADGEYDSAISSYEAALKIDPKNSQAASGLVATRQAKAAEESALQRLRKKPGA